MIYGAAFQKAALIFLDLVSMSTGLTKSPDTTYVPALDSLRFIAFLLIFVHHLPVFQSPVLQKIQEIGWLGVDIFFSLSAYLLTKLLMEERASRGQINYRWFFAKRVLRIWPLYFAYITVAIGYSVATKHTDVLRAAGLFTFTDNIFSAFQGYNNVPFTGHLWTISFEEQFYCAIPFFAAAVFSLTTIKKNFWLIAMALTSLVIISVMVKTGVRHPAIWVLPVSHSFSILSGIAVSINQDKFIGFSWMKTTIALFLSLALIGILPGTWKVGYSALFLYPLIGAASGLILAVFLKANAQNASILTLRALTFPGKISYGLYVVHAAAIEICFQTLHDETYIIPVIASLLLSMILATISYLVLEERFLEMKKRFTPVAN
jgi:peptidoglycan/LPS O-acetylase OafA/YrhL